jgi:hypothetical protein
MREAILEHGVLLAHLVSIAQAAGRAWLPLNQFASGAPTGAAESST